MRAFAVAAALALAWTGCRGEPRADERTAELDTVDVGPAIDAEASLEADAVEQLVGIETGGVAGVLPEDFPRDVPLPRPSTLVDFGPGWIVLEIDGGAAAVRDAYARQLAAAGFVAADGGRFRRGGRQVEVQVEGRGGAARVRIAAR